MPMSAKLRALKQRVEDCKVQVRVAAKNFKREARKERRIRQRLGGNTRLSRKAYSILTGSGGKSLWGRRNCSGEAIVFGADV